MHTIGLQFIPMSALQLNSVLFGILCTDNITPAGQPYILATLPPFSANILLVLQSMSAEIFSCIHKLNALTKASATTQEMGEEIEDSSEDGLDEEDRDIL